MRQFWCIWMAFIVAAFTVNSQNANVSLDHNQIKIGEQTTIELELRVPAAAKAIVMPALIDTLTKYVEIVKVSNIDTTFDEEDITTKIFTQTLTVTSWDSGFHAIPPFQFIVDGDTLKSEALLLTVNTIPIQADQDIKDIKNIIEVPFSLWDWILTNRLTLGLTLAGLILLVVAFILYRKYKNRPIEDKEIFIPKEAADKVANRKLMELTEKKLWQKDRVKEYHSELSFIIREYIENRFHLRALELTREEIIALVDRLEEVDKNQKARLNALLQLADLAKYAKQKPIASENEQVFKDATSFIEKTAYVEHPENEETIDSNNVNQLLKSDKEEDKVD